jgi:hypothetical protein
VADINKILIIEKSKKIGIGMLVRLYPLSVPENENPPILRQKPAYFLFNFNKQSIGLQIISENQDANVS